MKRDVLILGHPSDAAVLAAQALLLRRKIPVVIASVGDEAVAAYVNRGGKWIIIPLPTSIKDEALLHDYLFRFMQHRLNLVPVANGKAAALWEKLVPDDVPELLSVTAHEMADGWEREILRIVGPAPTGHERLQTPLCVLQTPVTREMAGLQRASTLPMTAAASAAPRMAKKGAAASIPAPVAALFGVAMMLILAAAVYLVVRNSSDEDVPDPAAVRIKNEPAKQPKPAAEQPAPAAEQPAPAAEQPAPAAEQPAPAAEQPAPAAEQPAPAAEQPAPAAEQPAPADDLNLQHRTVEQPAPDTKTPQSGSDNKTTKPGSGTKTTTSGSGTKTTKPGSDTKTTKPGSDTKTTKPGSDTKTTKSGSDTKTTKSGSDTKTTKPGSDTKTTKSGSQAQTLQHTCSAKPKWDEKKSDKSLQLYNKGAKAGCPRCQQFLDQLK